MRVLLLAAHASPEYISVPLLGWCNVSTLSRMVDAHVVTSDKYQAGIERAGWTEGKEFTAIPNAHIERATSGVAKRIQGDPNKAWTVRVAFSAIDNYAFEIAAWRRFKPALQRGDFDLVHRVTPSSPTIPSIVARKCKRLGVPFVVGPLNGGLPWPKGFDAVLRSEREWMTYVRSVYKFMPGYRSTLSCATAIIAGARAVLDEIDPQYHDKCVYIPENAIDTHRFPCEAVRRDAPLPLRVAFLGRLVPYKGCGTLIAALAPMMREGKVVLDILGDGPELAKLDQLVADERVGHCTTFHGWVPHAEIQNILRRAHVLGFPSIREFGGAVVLEAMALGVVPVVCDYGGPAELIAPDCGFGIPLTTPGELVDGVRAAFARILDRPGMLEAMSLNAQRRISRLFTWEAKARQICQVYEWALGKRQQKPSFG
ncbi:MAG: glycosyltransferase, partial [Candidatus Hydrogenedentes bacterium]|nr:glycosyltransferase [Candidatus Hydrogenedentota bacterium]